MIKQSLASRIFDVGNISLFILLSITMLYPLVYCLFLSLSSEVHASQGGLFLFPKSFDLTAYKAVFSKENLFLGLLNRYICEGHILFWAQGLILALVMNNLKI